MFPRRPPARAPASGPFPSVWSCLHMAHDHMRWPCSHLCRHGSCPRNHCCLRLTGDRIPSGPQCNQDQCIQAKCPTKFGGPPSPELRAHTTGGLTLSLQSPCLYQCDSLEWKGRPGGRGKRCISISRNSELSGLEGASLPNAEALSFSTLGE